MAGERRLSLVTIIGLLAWAAVTLMGLLAITEAIGWSTTRLLVVVQSATPLLLLPSIPIAVAGMLAGRHVLAATSALIAIALMIVTAPIVPHGDPPSVSPDEPTLTVLLGNLLFTNTETGAAAEALLAQDADVLVLVELTPQQSAALDDRGATTEYPNRVGFDDPGPIGIAVWSRLPLTDASVPFIGSRPGIDVVVRAHGGPLRIVAVHPAPPLNPVAMRDWKPDYERAADRALAAGSPTVLIGDFNASRWHAPFRDLLDRGLSDVHEWLGHGFSTSWPTDRWYPSFIRLDHALVTGGAIPVSVRDFEIPGSDHGGFVATVATP